MAGGEIHHAMIGRYFVVSSYMEKLLLFLAGAVTFFSGYAFARRNKHSIILKLNKLMANDEQALADLDAIKTQLAKIGTETSTSLQKIIDLENAANNEGVSQAILDKIAEVKAQAQIVDDMTPDAA